MSESDELIAEIEAIGDPEEKLEAARTALVGLATASVRDRNRKAWEYCTALVRNLTGGKEAKDVTSSSKIGDPPQ